MFEIYTYISFFKIVIYQRMFLYLPIDCGHPDNSSHAIVQTPTGTTYNSVAVYYCTIGYNMTGNNTRQCTTTGDWSGVAPSCNIIGK